MTNEAHVVIGIRIWSSEIDEKEGDCVIIKLYKIAYQEPNNGANFDPYIVDSGYDKFNDDAKKFWQTHMRNSLNKATAELNSSSSEIILITNHLVIDVGVGQNPLI